MKKVLLAALVLGLGFSVGGMDVKASDTCYGVKFKVKNSLKDNGNSREIRLKKVEFLNDNSGKWKTEDIAVKGMATHLEIGKGATKTTDGDDLSDVSGEHITKVKFVLQYKEGDGQWSKEITTNAIATPGDRDNQECKKGKTYGLLEIKTSV